MELDIILLNSAAIGDLEEVKKSLKNGADIEASIFQNRTALIWAIIRNHISVVKYLIKQKAIINTACLYTAIEYGRFKILKYLITQRYDLQYELIGYIFNTKKSSSIVNMVKQ